MSAGPERALTDDALRELAEMRAPGIVSCYLDVDGRRYLRHQDYEHELRVLCHNAQAAAGDRADLDRIEAYVGRGIDRSRTRGLALFACAELDLFDVFHLPVPVRSQVSVNEHPAVGRLEALLQHAESIGVLLVDRQRARVFVFELGELVEHTERFDEVPRDYDSRGEAERGDPDHHLDELAAQHLRDASAVAFGVHRAHPFAHFVLGARDEIAGVVETMLHPYLRERLAGRIGVAVDAPVDAIREAVMEAERAIERRREAGDVEMLRAAVGRGERGVAGLDAVLDALAERRVDRLLVSQGYVESGWHCPNCDRLWVVGRTCRSCRSEMVEVADVVEEAIEVALAHSCRVEICTDNADLDVLGRVGALLRY